MMPPSPAIRVIVEGPPTTVQRIADAIESVVSGRIDWRDQALSGSNEDYLIIEGAVRSQASEP